MPRGEPVDVTHEEVTRQPQWLSDLQPTAEYFRWGRLFIIASDDDVFDEGGDRWKHVSFSASNRLPDWEEIKAVRLKFFPPEAEVLQVLPPVSEYVNNHRFTLHLWWNKSRRLCPPMMRLAV